MQYFLYINAIFSIYLCNIFYIFMHNPVNVSKRGIEKIIKRYNTEGLYEDRKRSERPTKLSKRSMHVIHRMCLKNSAMSLRKISSSFNVGRSVNVARDTVSTILAKYGLHSHRPARKPFSTTKQRKRRME